MTAKERLVSELGLIRQEFPTLSRHLYNLIDAALAEAREEVTADNEAVMQMAVRLARKDQMKRDIAAVANAPVGYKSATACVDAIRRAFAEQKKEQEKPCHETD